MAARARPGREADVDRAQDARRQEQGHLDRRAAAGSRAPNKVRVSQPGEDGTPGGGGERVLQATDVILATGSRVKSLPGLDPGRQADRHQRRRPQDGHAARRTSSSSARARSASSSPRCTTTSASKVTLLEYLPAIVPLEDREVSKALERSFTPARDHGHDQRPLRRRRRSRSTKDGICLDGRAGGQGAAGAPRRAAARRRRPGRRTSRTSASRRRRPRSTGASSRSTAGCGRRSRTSTRSATSSAA